MRTCSQISLDLKNAKTAKAIEGELSAIGKLVGRALKSGYREVPRHRDFLLVVKDISARLRDLSGDARGYLSDRGQKVLVEEMTLPPTLPPSRDLVDPLCYSDFDRQISSLLSLAGSLAKPHVHRAKGRRPKYPERFLYAMLAHEYELATNMAANDKASRFMHLCDAVKEYCGLVDFRPEASSRASRKRRKGDRE